MFETLTDRLNETFARLGRKGRLTEQDVDDAMREVRRALLEADVNFKVAKDFVAAVRERAVGQDVLHSLTPAQTVIGIANEELIRVLGEEGQGLISPDRPPSTSCKRSASRSAFRSMKRELAAIRSISPPMHCSSLASAVTTRSSSTPLAACRSTTVSCRSWSISETACDRPRSSSSPTP